jgi:hypothetical protein
MRGRGMTVTILALIAIFLLIRMSSAAPVLNGFDLSGALVPVDAIERGGPPRDGIPSIDEPRFISADAASFLAPGDRVLGVHRNGVAKAYPVAILNWHEIVNDRFAGEPITVTYCPLCGTGMAYEARVGEQTLDFGVSGLLYNSDVLFYDRQTESLWSQIMARAVTGPMRGERLEMIALTHTTWADWHSRHPDTQVLSRETGYSRDYGRDPYAGYGRSAEIWFQVSHHDARFHPKEPVLGVEIDGHAKAWPMSALNKPELRDTVGGHDVIVRYDDKHETGAIHDAGTGEEIPSVIAFWFAWYAFYPETAVFE